MLKDLRNKLNKNPLLKVLSSIKLAVFLIIFLIILVIAGTLEQSSTGLYMAREKYFDTYLSFIGPVPLPGTLSILWLMTLNLSVSFFLRFNFTKKNIGLIMSHIGLILLFVSGFFHFYYSQESFIDIQEAERTSISQSYDNWVLDLKVLDDKFKSEKAYQFPLKEIYDFNIKLGKETRFFIEQKYSNAKVFHTPFAGTMIKEFPIEKEFEKNIPAIKLLIDDKELYLDGADNSFEKLFINKKNLILELKREEFKLPFQIKLLDVKRELHPNSAIAKSYSSRIILDDSKLAREAVISMNKPIRSGLYTVYQARYGVDLDGNEFSVLAVVKNLNYQLPYWATLLINLGLLIHFIIAFLNYKKKRSKE